MHKNCIPIHKVASLFIVQNKVQEVDHPIVDHPIVVVEFVYGKTTISVRFLDGSRLSIGIDQPTI